jgi:hypothetical protein
VIPAPGCTVARQIRSLKRDNLSVSFVIFFPAVVFSLPFPISQVGTNSFSLTPAPRFQVSSVAMNYEAGAFEVPCTRRI